jgi:hypothetical protein
MYIVAGQLLSHFSVVRSVGSLVTLQVQMYDSSYMRVLNARTLLLKDWEGGLLQ